MKISFLVLVACLCLAAEVSAKRTERKETAIVKNDQGLDVNLEKTFAEEERLLGVNTYEEGGAIIEEETKNIRHSTNTKRKGKRKQEKWVQAENKEPCSKLLAKDEVECLSGCNKEQVCKFVIESEDTCAWNCNCESIIVEQIETVVETEAENGGVVGEKRKRKVKKEAAEGEKKKRKSESGKECSGLKRFNFANCLIKLKGLAAYGDDASPNNFEIQWNSL